MAKVLVVDDLPANRELVVTLLAHRGHTALEAADGAEGLKLVRAEHPDLIICDILMPTMDGFEFVRQLRSDPRHRQAEVIFYTAHYHEREARKLAKACGVSRILVKPSDPEEMLRVIDAALAHKTSDATPAVAPEFDREHLRLMTDKLSQKVDELRATNERLQALTEINLRLASERDPHRLLDQMCHAARDLAGAKYGLLCVRSKVTGNVHFATSGFDPSAVQQLGCPTLDSGVLARVIAEARPRRMSRASGDKVAEALPAEFPRANSILVSPIGSVHSVYGWICLMDKIGADEFSEEDERMLSMHASQTGRIYENGSLYMQVERHAAKLREEIAERERAEIKIRHLNRVYAVLSGINTLIVRVRNRDELFRHACEIAVDAGRFRLAWIGLVDRATMQINPVAWHGANEDFGAHVATGLDPSAHDNYGVGGRAVVEKQAIIIDDVATDPRVQLSRQDMLARGIHSLAALPLIQSDHVVGVLTLCAPEVSFFNDEEMRLLHELAGDISFALDNIAKEEKLNYLAYYDPLTGLANTALFRDRLEQFVQAAARDNRPFAVAIFDVAHFRTVNESAGRHAGDQLLKQIAARLTRDVASPLECARLDADHFALALPGIRQEADAAHRVDAIHDALFGAPYLLDESTQGISARAGLAMYPSDGSDPDTLLRHAEEALKRAKATGERSLFYAQDMSVRVAERFGLESRLRHALENDEFVLHYQPKVDLSTRSIQGVEALIRWQSPERGLVPPVEFISLLEETGLIREVGLWAVRRAVSDQRRWAEQKLAAPRIAVNVSAVQLRHRDFVDALHGALQANGQSPAIDIEITESLITDDVVDTIEKLKKIRDMGVGIAIDDFGTGYSSLGYLTRLPVHSLKIDRSFIVTMTDDPDTMAIVSTIISLAHSLALKVIAEGVETEEQARVLRLFRCDEMQGYLISRPVPAPAIVPFLAIEET